MAFPVISHPFLGVGIGFVSIFRLPALCSSVHLFLVGVIVFSTPLVIPLDDFRVRPADSPIIKAIMLPQSLKVFCAILLHPGEPMRPSLGRFVGVFLFRGFHDLLLLVFGLKLFSASAGGTARGAGAGSAATAARGFREPPDAVGGSLRGCHSSLQGACKLLFF